MFQRGAAAAALLAVLGIGGCLTIQKRTLVIALPEGSKEIRLYYSFAGLGVSEANGGGAAAAEMANKQLAELAKDNFGFFVQMPPDMQGQVTDSPAAKAILAEMKFEKLRAFRDPAGPRPLGADRRVTIPDGPAFVAKLNDLLRVKTPATPEQLRKQFEQTDGQLRDENTARIAEGFGAQPLLEVARALTEVAKRMDDASLAKLGAADHFDVLRLRPGRLVVMMRCTKEHAKAYAADPHAQETVARLEKLVKPLAIEATDDGLAFVLGKPGVPIVLTYEDPRPQNAAHDGTLAEALGQPGPATLAGKPASAAALLRQFLDEQRPAGK